MRKLIQRVKHRFREGPSQSGSDQITHPPDSKTIHEASSVSAPSSTGYGLSEPHGLENDIHSRDHHFAPPHHRHGHRGFPGLNSPFGEALTEYYNLSSLDELRSLVSNHWPELMPALDSILAAGISSPPLVVDLLQIDEASERLQRIRDLIILSSQSELLIILPLPPHITNHLARHINMGLLLTSSYHMPPHLHGWPCDHIDSIMPDHLIARLNSTKAIAVEGMYQQGNLWLATNVIKFLYLVKPHYPEVRLFVHSMPHPPRHVELAKLSVSYPIHTI